MDYDTRLGLNWIQIFHVLPVKWDIFFGNISLNIVIGNNKVGWIVNQNIISA